MIYGFKEGGGSAIQALRYDKKIWTEDSAKSHCKSRGGTFEAAGEGKMKAYSILELKSFDEDQRILEGIATTPTPDRVNDVIVAEGIEYKLPLPFLYQHNSRQPIGNVIEAKLIKGVMHIKAKIADLRVPGFIDEAWELIKAKLVRGLSIGFRSLEERYDKEIGGYKYLRSEILEISAVTIPANQEATILAVKSYDQAAPAAIGRKAPPVVKIQFNQPGDSGTQTQKEGNKMARTLEDQIAALEAKRQANVARSEAIRNKAADEGRVMDNAEREEFDGLSGEIESVDEDLSRLKRLQKQIKTATPITDKTGGSQDEGSAARGGIVSIRPPEVAKGMGFTRFAMAMMASKGDRQSAYDMVRSNKDWKESTPQVEKFLANPRAFMMIKAAAAAGDTTTAGWAAEIADYTYMASEFIEYLRPKTVIGRIPSWRKVPFNIKVPTQSAGSTVNWVGEGLAKPVTGLTLSTAYLRFAKVAGIIVLTEELVRFSNPAAEGLVRDDMAAQIIQFLDQQFLDPSVAAVANVSPAAITNGAGTAAASGGTADDFRYDLQLALTQMIAANIDVAGVYIIMQSSLALAMSLMRNDLGNKEFPELTVDGGRLEGFNCITSQSCPAGVIVFVKPSEIMLADDGEIRMDVSKEATVTMDDGTSPPVTTQVNFWQNDLVGIKVERVINWRRRRDAAVYYISGAAYGAASP